MFDLVIKNATVIDGSGKEGFISDIGIKNGKIAKVAEGLSAERVLDAKELVVTPDFIDSHAQVYGFGGKGLIKEGYDADLVIFDYKKIRDNCDYTACHLHADGLSFVIINGEVVVENAIYNGKKMAKIIKKK